MKYLGLSKTVHNSGVSFFDDEALSLVTIISERVNREKYSGAWPFKAIEFLSVFDLNSIHQILENRDIMTPFEKEEMFNQSYPFYEHIKKNKFGNYVKKFNPNIKTISHHLCHAYSSVLFSPFQNCLILVVDSSGSKYKDLEQWQKDKVKAKDDELECLSVYSWEDGQLSLLEKEFHSFRPSNFDVIKFSNGLGAMYEKVSEFIFNENTASGKVMGLAAYGTPFSTQGTHFEFLNQLDWSLQYKGQSKQEWQKSKHMSFYKDLAATAQARFEKEWLEIAKRLKKKYPQFQNIILSGGCALNCTANWKLIDSKIYDNVYVTPFPGDESISIGLVASELINRSGFNTPTRMPQISYWGSPQHGPEKFDISLFQNEFKIIRPENIEQYCADLLNQGRIIGWFQGRSEVGPRALGNRSILARPDSGQAKELLNRDIKFREDFRPYGCTVMAEQVDRFFATPRKFQNPFMSFAVPVKGAWQELLKDIVHKDGTCRMQTLERFQNQKFYNLLCEFEKLSGIPMLLNTSLNIMGQPILETSKDLMEFLREVPVYGVAVGDYFIFSSKSEKSPQIHL